MYLTLQPLQGFKWPLRELELAGPPLFKAGLHRAVDKEGNKVITSTQIRSLLPVAMAAAMTVGCVEGSATSWSSHWHTGDVTSVVTLDALPSGIEASCTSPPANSSQNNAAPVAIVSMQVGRGHFHQAFILPKDSTIKQGDVVVIESKLCIIRPHT